MKVVVKDLAAVELILNTSYSVTGVFSWQHFL